MASRADGLEKRLTGPLNMVFQGPMKISAANEANAQSNWAVRFWPWLMVAVIILFVGCIRVRLLSTALERDEGEYAYAGQLILQGIPPYELAYNMKLPGTYYAYALGMAVFGQTAEGVHLTLLAVNSLTCIFVFLLGRKLSGDIAGVAACAGYAVMSASLVVLGLAAHATQFVALFGVLGALLLSNAKKADSRPGYFVSGLMFGLAFLMKQPGICFGMFGLAFLIGSALHDRVIKSKNFLFVVLNMLAGLALPLALFCVAALVAGDFGRFWFWTVDYARHYAVGNTLATGLTGLINRLRDQLLPYGILWLLAAAGWAAMARAREKRTEFIFVSTLLIFSVLGIVPGLRFRSHYFVLMLPALALVLGLGTERLSALLRGRGSGWMAPAVLGVALAWCVFVQRWVFFQMTPEQICEATYSGNPFLESVQMAQAIRDHSKPDALVAVVGSEPEIYFYSQRHSATGYIYTYPLMESQPYAGTMQKEMIDQIETNRPEFIVMVAYKLSWLKSATSDLTIWKEMKDYTRKFYEPVAALGRQPEPTEASPGNSVKGAPNAPAESMILYQRKTESN